MAEFCEVCGTEMSASDESCMYGHEKPAPFGFAKRSQSAAVEMAQALKESGAQQSTHTANGVTVVAYLNDHAPQTYEQGVIAGFDEAICEVRRGEINPKTYKRRS